MMESVDLARRAALAGGPDSLGDLTERVRTALAEIVAGEDQPLLAGRTTR